MVVWTLNSPSELATEKAVRRQLRRAKAGGIGLFAATLAVAAMLTMAEGPTEPPPDPFSLESSSLDPTPIDPPAAPGSTSPAIAAEGATTYLKGHYVLMTWLEPGDSGGSLKFSRFAEGEWTPPVTIADRVSQLAPADWPSLTVFDTQGVRRTLIARTGDIVARSGDAGWTWSRLPAPALPFASFAGGDEGGYAFWLDSDNGSTTLVGARVLAGGKPLDSRVAGGSATAAAMTWDGPIVVYRDRGFQDALDISVVRRQDAKWTPSRPVHVDGWRPDRKPTSSPRVAALRRQVAIAWYTESRHRPRIVVAFSTDAGRTIEDPVEVDAREADRAPLGPVDVALDDNGDALVLWTATSKVDAQTDAGAGEVALKLARVTPAGNRGEELVLARGPRDGFEGLPKIARAGSRVAVTWVEGGVEGELTRIRAVAVPLAGISTPGGRPAPAVTTAEAAETRPKPYSGRGRKGEPFPGFELQSLDEEEVTLEAVAGRAVLLNLWATWCLPCIEEMPEIAALHERYEAEGLEVVGLSVDSADATDKVHAFVAEHEIPFTIWLDPAMALYRDLRIRSLPVTFVLDREGRIVLRRNGRITADDPELKKALRRALR